VQLKEITSNKQYYLVTYVITSFFAVLPLQLCLKWLINPHSGSPRDQGSTRVWLFYRSLWEYCMCFQIFINCILVNMTSSQRNQTWIWVWQQEKLFFFRSSDNIQGKQDSVKFRIEDACCTRQPNSWRTTFTAQGCRNSVAHFRTIGIDMIEILKRSHSS